VHRQPRPRPLHRKVDSPHLTRTKLGSTAVRTRPLVEAVRVSGVWRYLVPELPRRGLRGSRLLVAFAASPACVAGVASGAVADSAVPTDAVSTDAAGLAGSTVEWPMGGHDLSNSRSNPAEFRIGPRTAGRLGLAWSAPTGGDVSATPAVVGGAVYF